jgi:hypothetical protein
LREALLKIIDGEGHPEARDRVEAAKALVVLDLAVFKAEIETGMLKKPIDEIARQFQYEPLPPETRTIVIAAWVRGGMLPKPVIERMIPAKQITESDIDHGNAGRVALGAARVGGE